MHKLKIFWNYFSAKRKTQVVILLFLMVFSSVLEVISLGSVIPFLGVISSPDDVFQQPLLQPLIYYFRIESPEQLVVPLTVIFIVSVILSGIARIVLLYANARLSQAIGADIGYKAFSNTLYKDYEIQKGENSGDLISGIIVKVDTVVGGIVGPTLSLVSSIIIFLGIMTVLVLINPMVSILVFFIILLFYYFIIFSTKKILKRNSDCISSESNQIVRTLQEGFGNVKDVLIGRAQEYYANLYRNSDVPMRVALANNQFIASAPRFVFESLGIVSIVLFAYLTYQENGSISGIIPTLGVFALGAQRLLPILQQMYAALSTLIGSISSFDDVLNFLNYSMNSHIDKSASSSNLSFLNKISLENVTFNYLNEGISILKNISLDIEKGHTIGFVGETGSGKSTLLDIVMGLLHPTNGLLKVDGKIICKSNLRAWQLKISHVPQHIYLSDNTVEKNIAFGVGQDEIDQERIRGVAAAAHILGFVEKLPNKFKTTLGEGGVNLSGGQRQRIGIARALYRDSDVLILDEATSALDDTMEGKITKSISQFSKNMTILIIAHRLKALKNCNKIVKIKNGSVNKITNYNEIINEESKKK